MLITNLDEIVLTLRQSLREYLSLQLGKKSLGNKFKCFAHEEDVPSMSFNPKANGEVVYCFGCHRSFDIFSAAHYLEGLPDRGPEWITETIPALAEKLGIPLQLGEPTLAEKEKLKLYRLAQDISDILMHSTCNRSYIVQRGWEQDHLIIGSLDEDVLIAELVEKGWSPETINSSLLIRNSRTSFFGTNKITFSIKDYRGRTIGFISRNLEGSPKYINTPNSTLYNKSSALLGIDVAVKTGARDGIYVVEGPGDLAQLYRLGIKNAVAACGTAFTKGHFALLQMLNIREINFCFDWDRAGTMATQRVFRDELRAFPGISCYVVEAPESTHTDPDEYLKCSEDPNDFYSLRRVPAFEWMLRSFSDNNSPDTICREMLPIIAAEPTAIKRELLIGALSEYTNISIQSIAADVSTIRDRKLQERDAKIKAAAYSYLDQVERDPSNIQAIIAQHEENIRHIEKEYDSSTIGVNYQLQRYITLQEIKQGYKNGSSHTFKMQRFEEFARVMGGGMPWTAGCLIYCGGRANSGKTAICIALAVDILLTDEDSVVIIHSTDDSYIQIEPRLKTNIARMLTDSDDTLDIGMAVNPLINITSKKYAELYNRTDQTIRDLLAQERLVIIDAEDGSTLSVLEKHIRYIRRRYPSKKIFVVCDNTHNYRDYMDTDRASRMSFISDTQKSLTNKYQLCMLATAEYRKNMPLDSSRLVLPVNDDLADSRSLMFRPNVILHVYNDLHDRKEHAEIFWVHPKEPNRPRPRLLLLFSKNKITDFKDKLVMDLDPRSVTLTPIPKDVAYLQFEEFCSEKNNGAVDIRNDQIVTIEATEYNA